MAGERVLESLEWCKLRIEGKRQKLYLPCLCRLGFLNRGRLGRLFPDGCHGHTGRRAGGELPPPLSGCSEMPQRSWVGFDGKLLNAGGAGAGLNYTGFLTAAGVRAAHTTSALGRGAGGLMELFLQTLRVRPGPLMKWDPGHAG